MLGARGRGRAIGGGAGMLLLAASCRLPGGAAAGDLRPARRHPTHKHELPEGVYKLVCVLQTVDQTS